MTVVKITNKHPTAWLCCALERILGGEREADVLLSYGYRKIADDGEKQRHEYEYQPDWSAA